MLLYRRNSKQKGLVYLFLHPSKSAQKRGLFADAGRLLFFTYRIIKSIDIL